MENASDSFEDDHSEPPSEGISSVDEEQYDAFKQLLPVDPELKQHPIFLLQDDSLMSILTKPLEGLIRISPNLHLIKEAARYFKEEIYREIFQDKQVADLNKEFSSLNLSHKTICGKLIPLNGLYFRCLDCDTHEVSTFISLLCVECFDKSKHEGHRILIVKKEKTGSATCDCGDAESFKPEGFCSQHQPKEVKIDELLQKFPKDILEKFQVVMKKAFYGVISLFEISDKASNESVGNAVMLFAEQCLSELLSFCELCYSQISEAFLSIFEIVFSSFFMITHNKLWHDCNDLKAEKKPEEIDVQNSNDCSCTIAANLIRIGNLMRKDLQSKTHKILIECAKQPNFKEFLALEFSKYIHFLYSQEYTNDASEDEENSRLLNMKTQLYGRESLLLKVLESGNFENYLSVLRRVICNAPQMNHEVYHIISDVRSSILYFLNSKYKSSDILLKKSNLLQDIVEALINFQIKFVYQGKIKIGLFEHLIQYQSLNCGLMVEKVTCQVVENGIRTICKYPEQEKIPLVQNLAKQICSGVELTKEILDGELKSGTVSFNPALERVFSYLIRTYVGDSLTKQSLEKFFGEILPEINLSQTSENISQGVLRSLGMVRYLHIVHNFKTGMLWYVYYFFNNTFFETDITTIQIAAMLINPENIFEFLTNNFFSYSLELQQFFKDPHALKRDDYFKQKLSVLGDFFNFLIYLMNDEICFLNLELKDSGSDKGEFKPSARYKKVFEKVLINVLLGQFWTDVNHTKNQLKEILKEHHEIDDIIPKITITDEKNHKIRIKDEYIKDFDPYIFYRTPAVQSNILNNVTSKAKKDQPVDVVSGKYYPDLPQYLKTIQRNLYESNLPNFLSVFLGKIIPETTPLVRPVLKLILLNLQIAEENIISSSNGSEAINKKIEECYLTGQFSANLANILKDDSLKDCEMCIKNIQELIKKLGSQLHAKASKEKMIIEEGENQQEIKKKLAMEKMQKMKEAFAKKQEKFKMVNTDLLSKSFDSEECKNEENIGNEQEKLCQHCLDKINETNEEYGIPVYVAFTNNFYDTEKEVVFKKWDYSYIAESQWWPVISSCNHYYHKKCFNILYKNSRKSNDNSKTFFSNLKETYCSLCKCLCNGFLSMNEDTCKSEVESENKEENPPIYGQLTKDIYSLLKADVIKLKNNINLGSMEEEIEMSPDKIMFRVYWYYLEAFYLHKSPEALNKEFNLYTEVFKEFVGVVKSEGWNVYIKEDLSILDIIVKGVGLFPHDVERAGKDKKIGLSQILRENQCEQELNQFAFNKMIMLSTEEQNNLENAVKETHLKLIKEYLIYKMIQLLSFEQEINLQNLNEVSNYFKNTQEFQTKFLSEIIFPLQKLVLAYCLNSSVFLNQPCPEELGLYLCNSSATIENFNHLAKLLGFSTFDLLIESCFDELKNKSKIDLFLLETLLTVKESEKVIQKPRVIKYAPHKLQLPPNFAEFNGKYYTEKCSLCDNYSKHMLSSICLVCGQVMCQAYCNPQNKVYGNLNRHASEYHMGLGLFFDVHHMSQSILSVPINAIFSGKNLYIDHLGQGIQVFLHERRSIISSLDFKKFLLNEEFLNYKNDIINHHAMGKEVFKIARTAHYYYHNGNL